MSSELAKNIIILYNVYVFKDWIAPLSKVFNVVKYKNIDSLREYIKNNNVKMIIPLYYDMVKILIDLNINCFCLCPQKYDLIDIFHNKCNFADFCIENTLESYIPTTYVINSAKTKLTNKIIYPAIMKDCESTSGLNCNILYKESDEPTVIKRYCIIQEYIFDEYEYVGNFIVMNGDILYSLFFKQQYEKFFIKKRNMDNYEICECDKTPFEIIFTKLKYTGAACADFKIVNGQIKILEINPRFGGTFVHSKYLTNILDVFAKIKLKNKFEA